MDALLKLLGINSEIRRFKRLQRAMAECYPGVEMKVVNAAELAQLRADAKALRLARVGEG